jgi:lipoprotein-anchoring transpeptidase ErfK/SrfK
VIGKPSTPTPTGFYQVMEVVHQSSNAPTGPVALVTNDYSNVLQEFDGGPGQIALHGTGTLPGLPGSASSHGCIRSPDQTINKLGQYIPTGTTIKITR